MSSRVFFLLYPGGTRKFTDTSKIEAMWIGLSCTGNRRFTSAGARRRRPASMEEKIVIGRPKEAEEPPKRRRTPWFWWILANATAACLAVLTWAGCLYVFNQPEKPENYRILERIGRPPELEAFTALDAPEGAPADPPALYRKFLALDARQRARLNPRLLRNYLENFERPEFNTYVEGRFRIRKVRALTENDLFHPGLAVRIRAEVENKKSRRTKPYPVWIDILLPTRDLKTAATQLKPGDTLILKKAPNCVAVLHVDRFTLDEEPQILLTATPVAYGEFTDGKKNRRFSIAPPERIRPDAEFPVFPTEE